MTQFTYDNPQVISYNLDKVSVSSAAELRDIIGPAGLQGRVISIGSVITTTVTTAVSDISVGITGTLKKFATQVITVSAADVAINAIVNSASDSNLLPADTRAVISSGGGAAAGVVDSVVTIGWF